MTGDKRSKQLLILYVVLLFVTVGLVMKFGSPQEKAAKKVGLIVENSVEEQGWSAVNYKGMQEACNSLGIKLLVRDEVPQFDGSCPQAVQELVEEGAEMIVLCSSGYSQELEPYYGQYPQISFYGLYADCEAPNLTGYSTRIYQARYLSGIIAGMYTKSNKIGFVAPESKSEVCRSINAFTLGVRRVNPEAEVIVAWTGSMNDPETEKAVAEALIEEEQVDVITDHQDRDYVVEVAEEAGVASIGYYSMLEDASEKYLTCVSCDWAILYEELLQEHLRGQSSNMVNDWLGLESGAVHLTGYSSMVSQEAVDEVEKAKAEILSGLDVFTGEIYDNQHRLRCGEGEAMSDEVLMWSINWLVEGVRVYE